MSGEQNAAVDLLYDHLGSLPHPEYGVINLLPWAVNSDQTNTLKRQVCEAIIEVFRSAGYPMVKDVPIEPSRDVKVHCRACSSELFTAAVNDDGVANVPAAAFIASLARLRPECPHGVTTFDDQRRAIEEAVLAAQG